MAAPDPLEGGLSVALLQDIAAIPVLARVPLLAAGQAGASAEPGHDWWAAGQVLAVVAAILFGGGLLLRPALRWIVGSDTPEIFTAAAQMQKVGLSTALGAFLAGVLLAESAYRRALETDIEPFKGLLLGLDGLATAGGPQPGAAFSPAHHRANRADAAAPGRRAEADRAVQAGPPAVGAGVGAGA